MAFMPQLALLLSEGSGKFNPLDLTTWTNAMWTGVVFIIALPLMWKVVFGPITKALSDRDEKASDAIGKAEAAKTAAEAAKVETQAALAQAREQAGQQLRDARELAEKQKAELMAKAQEDAANERSRAIAEIEAEKQKAKSEIRDLVVDLSLELTSKLLRREVTGDDQKSMVEAFLKDMDRPEVRN